MPGFPFVRIVVALAMAPAATTMAFALGGGRAPATAPGERWSALARAEYRGWLALHKSIGLCVPLLVPLRMAWNLAVQRPPLVGVDTAAQRFTLSAVHVTLYALMLAVPVVGWFASMTYGGKTSFFGLYELPMLVGLHAAAAVWHHALRRDATLMRMLPGK